MNVNKLTILSALLLTIGCGPIDVDLGDLSTDGDNDGSSADGSGGGGVAVEPDDGSGGWGASGGEAAGGTGGWGGSAGEPGGFGGRNGACSQGLVGDSSRCVDPSTLEQEALAACHETGGRVQQLFFERCEGGATRVGYDCCPADLEPSECRGGLISVGASCVDEEQLREWADLDCGSTGEVVSVATPGGDCGDGRSSVLAYECCSASDPAPGCFSNSIEFPECVSNDVIRAQAELACAGDGSFEPTEARLGSFEPANNCENGSSSATYTCCGAEDGSSGVPIDPVCWSAELETGGVCTDRQTLTELAVLRCMSAFEHPTNVRGDVTPHDECGTDAFMGATVTCCSDAE